MRRTFAELTEGVRPHRLDQLGRIAFLAGWTVFAAAAATLFLGGKLRPVDLLVWLWLALFLLASGVTFLILSTLRAGFGSLDWFFQEALARSARRAAPPAQEAPTRASSEAARRGYIGERPFTLYDDGSVAVETLLGMRVFGSMAEAQEFIGA